MLCIFPAGENAVPASERCDVINLDADGRIASHHSNFRPFVGAAVNGLSVENIGDGDDGGLILKGTTYAPDMLCCQKVATLVRCE